MIIVHEMKHNCVVCSFSDEDFGERNVSIVLDDVESELVFIDHTNGEMSVRIQK